MMKIFEFCKRFSAQNIIYDYILENKQKQFFLIKRRISSSDFSFSVSPFNISRTFLQLLLYTLAFYAHARIRFNKYFGTFRHRTDGRRCVCVCVCVSKSFYVAELVCLCPCMCLCVPFCLPITGM